MQTKLKDLPDLFSKKVYNDLKRSLIFSFTLNQYIDEGGKCSGKLQYINKKYIPTITKKDVLTFNRVLRKKIYTPNKCNNCGKTCRRAFSVGRDAAFRKENKECVRHDYEYHIYKHGRSNVYLCLRNCNIYGGNDDLTIEYKNGLSTKAYHAGRRKGKPNPQIANQVMLFIVKQVVDTVVYEAQKLLQENACSDELSEFSYRHAHGMNEKISYPYNYDYNTCTRFCDQWNIRYTDTVYLQRNDWWTRWVYVSDLQDWFDALKVHVQLQLKERAIQIAKCLNPPSSYVRDGLKQQKTLKLTNEYSFIPINEAFKAKVTLPELPPQVIQIIYDYAIPQRQYVVPPSSKFLQNPTNSNILQHLCYVCVRTDNVYGWAMNDIHTEKRKQLIRDALLRGNSKQHILKLLY